MKSVHTWRKRPNAAHAGLAAFIAAFCLGGCAIAPGMHAPARHDAPPVTLITPSVIASQERPAQENVQQLLQTFADQSYAYRIGASDVLAIGVVDHPELVPPDAPVAQDGRARAFGFVVDASGQLDYPYVGKLDVAGKSAEQVRGELTEKLSRYIRKPQLIVRVIDFRSQRIYVDGALRSPGSRPISDVPMTLALAIAEAGGIPANGDASHLTITRAGRTYPVDLPALASAGYGPQDLCLRNLDRVQVSERVDNPVFVAGEVGQPRAVPLRDGRLSLGDALAQAGSVSQIGSNPSGVYVVRLQGRDALPTVYQLDATSPTGLALAGRFPLRANDLVYVETARLMRWNRVMNLLLSSSLSLYNTQRAVDGP